MRSVFIKILITFVILFTSLSYTFGAETSVKDILGETNTETVIDDLNKIEEQRNNSFSNLLKLELPSQTDNPNYSITFIDPSEDKKGVQLEIDNKKYVILNLFQNLYN